MKTCGETLTPPSRLFSRILAIACSWPVVTHAAEISIPELGVELVNVPSGMDRPEVIRRFDGYATVLDFGKARLNISRFEEAVPSGSDIRNDRFRAAQEPPSYAMHPHPRGQATTVDGHDAWTITWAVRSGAPGSEEVLWTSITYALVDQHVYSFDAHGIGGNAPPADFVAAVRAISDLTFIAVDRSAESGGKPPSGLIRMPGFFPSNRDWYPAAARRRGDVGVVDLEFSIDGKGHARDVQQIYAATEELAASARSMLTDMQFHLTSGWEDRGYQKLRFTIEVQYSLKGSGHPCVGEALPPRVPDAPSILICGSR
jgi:hypothetical protein